MEYFDSQYLGYFQELCALTEQYEENRDFTSTNLLAFRPHVLINKCLQYLRYYKGNDKKTLNEIVLRWLAGHIWKTFKGFPPYVLLRLLKDLPVPLRWILIFKVYMKYDEEFSMRRYDNCCGQLSPYVWVVEASEYSRREPTPREFPTQLYYKEIAPTLKLVARGHCD